jgi:hypothetical protein
MKNSYLILLISLLCGHLFSQKNQTVQTANLNLSKSNINRLIYPPLLVSSANAQLILDELEKTDPMDAERQKTWLAANFKRFGIEPALVKQISIFSGRQYADCSICKQHCKGRCVQDPGADCICMYRSEPNLRMASTDKPLTFILLTTDLVEEQAALEMVSSTITSAKRATTVKSGKSNSSD